MSAGKLISAAVAAYALFAVALASTALAVEAPPSFFTEFPEDRMPGGAAGELAAPNALVSDPTTHHVFIVERANNRISEYTAWGQFIRAFGWGVRTAGSQLEECRPATGCMPGLPGSDPGQLNAPNGLALDGEGNLYVFEVQNHRVQVFDPTAGPEEEDVEFKLNFGSEGTGPGQFMIENVFGVLGNYIAVGPDDLVYVADKNRIQKFELNGTLKGSFALPEEGNPGALAVDPSTGALYFAFNQTGILARSTIFKLSPSGAVLGQIKLDLFPEVAQEVDSPIALHVDQTGNLYVVDDPLFNNSKRQPRVLQFDSGGSMVTSFDEIPIEEVTAGLLEEPALSSGSVGEGTSEMDIYVVHRRSGDIASVKVYGPTPDPDVVGPPPKVPPTISDQFANAVSTTGATLKATISPHFWDDATYYLEWGKGKCSEGGCTNQQPAPPGASLTTKIVNAPITTAGIFLAGLEPGATYHYRFVAQSSGSEGEPVRGVGGEVGVDGAEGAFTTRGLPEPPETDCSNQAFRTGVGARLPDCRAYEMVSPVDKAGADIVALGGASSAGTSKLAALDQSALGGSKLTYSSYKAFGDAVSSPFTSQYMATRGAGGWESHGISPPREGPTLLQLIGLDVQFKHFSPDLCEGTLLQDTALSLAPGSVPGFANLYGDELCGGMGYEPITVVPPPTRQANKYLLEVQGVSGDGRCTIYRANDKLTANAASGEGAQVYEKCGGEATKLVCAKPGGAAAGPCSAGTQNGLEATLANAISKDGSVVYWTAAETGPGKLYRFEGGSESVAVSGGPARYWTAAVDGSVAIFSEGGELFSFSGAGPQQPIVGGFEGLLGASEDASRLYLLSSEALDGAAVAGKPNLYLYEAGEPGTFTYIATLAPADAATQTLVGTYTPVNVEPYYHSARVSPDGGAVAFTSTAPLTGYDSKDANSGEVDAEVFLWSAADEELICASCDPTGARPSGRNLANEANPFWAAAIVPGAPSQLYSSRALSDGGRRLFFDSYVPLVPTDTNGRADVYQWEAEGEGRCRKPGGCVSLISAGEGVQDSSFLDADANGKDAFFATGASLLPQDPGLIDIYDARVEGGFPPPELPALECEGEACQSPVPAPEHPSPSSSSYQGAGNVREGRPRKPCPKGKRPVRRGGKARCVKSKHGKQGRDHRRHHAGKQREVKR